jgi:hypothetical protein
MPLICQRYIPFSEVRQLSPQAFVNILAQQLRPAGVVAGINYRFGETGNAARVVWGSVTTCTACFSPSQGQHESTSKPGMFITGWYTQVLSPTARFKRLLHFSVLHVAPDNTFHLDTLPCAPWAVL